ncbi:hypothetical protein SK128_015137 [Halocaridina rubra]|uniref:Peptidase M12A domain-containing protein n=1 Tax=Halocaridina rubra TaxID=373956 RepID=A0AAN8WKD7_HALRR
MAGMGHITTNLTNTCDSVRDISRFIGYAFGLIPEELRPDRDKYIIIKYENSDMDPDDFPPSIGYNTHGIPFDYTSVSLANGKSHTKNDHLTITAKDPQYQGLIGRLDGKISHRNYMLVNAVHKCKRKFIL